MQRFKENGLLEEHVKVRRCTPKQYQIHLRVSQSKDAAKTNFGSGVLHLFLQHLNLPFQLFQPDEHGIGIGRLPHGQNGRGRGGQTADAVLKKVNSEAVGKVLKPIFAKDTLLCADGISIYGRVVQELDVPLKAMNVKAVKQHLGLVRFQQKSASILFTHG